MEPASKKKVIKKSSKRVVSVNVKDYSNDPFVIKKGKAPVVFLNKHGFPKELLEKK